MELSTMLQGCGSKYLKAIRAKIEEVARYIHYEETSRGAGSIWDVAMPTTAATLVDPIEHYCSSHLTTKPAHSHVHTYTCTHKLGCPADL